MKTLRKTMAIVLSALLIFAVLPIVAIGVSADDVSDAAALRTALTGSATATLVLKSDITLSDVDGTMTLGNAAKSIDLNGHTLSYVHDDSVTDVIPCMNLTNSKTTLTITNSSPDGLGGLASSVNYPLFAGSKKLAFGAGTMNNSYFCSTATYSTFAQDAVVSFNADCKLGSVTFSRATVSFNGKLDITGSASFSSGGSATTKTTVTFYKPVTVGSNFGTSYDSYNKRYAIIKHCTINFANPYFDAENPGSTLTAGNINFGSDWCNSTDFATFNFASDVISNGTFSFGRSNAEYFKTPTFGRNVTAGSIEYLSRSTIPGNLTTTIGNCVLNNIVVNGNVNCAGNLSYSSNNYFNDRSIVGTTTVSGNLTASGYSTAAGKLVSFNDAVTVGGNINAKNAIFAANTTAAGKIKLTGTTVTGTISGEAELEFVSGSVSTDLILAPTTLIQAGDFAGIVTAPAGSDVTVNGGAFTAAAFIGNDTADITIKGGTFSTQPSTIAGVFVDGTEIDNGNGTYTVKHAYFQIGTTQYYTLAEAVTAVADGGEIDLIEDYIITAKQIFSKNVTLDLNGHKIQDGYFALIQSTASGLDYTINAGYTLTMISTGDTRGEFKIHNGSGDAERPVFYAKGNLISYNVNFANGATNKSSIARAYSDSTIEIHNSTISCGYTPIIMNGVLTNCTVNLYSVKCTATNGNGLDLAPSTTSTNVKFNVQNESTDTSAYGSSFNGKTLSINGAITASIKNTQFIHANDGVGSATITGGANVSFKNVSLSSYASTALTVTGTNTFFSAEDSTIAGKKALVLSGTTETVIKNSTINANANGSSNFSITVSATTAKLTLSDTTLTKNTSTIAWMSVVDGYTDQIIKSGYSVYSGETASAETLKTFEYLTTTNTNFSAYILPALSDDATLNLSLNNSSVTISTDDSSVTEESQKPIENGTPVTLTANVSGKPLLFWTEDGKVRSEEPTYSFTMNGARNIDAVFEPGEGEGSIVIYRNVESDTKQVLGYETYLAADLFAGELVSTAYCYGKTFTGWSKNVDDIKAQINVESVIYVDAIFTDIAATYSVTVNGGSITAGEKTDYNTDDIITIVATDTDNFKCWTDANGAIVSTKAAFTYKVGNRDVVLTAQNTSPADAQINLTVVDDDSVGKLKIYNSYYLPEDMTVVDVGLIYTKTAAAILSLEDVNGTTIKATHLGATGKQIMQIFNTISNASPVTLCGYVVYTDGEGASHTLYSTVYTK